MNRLNLMFALPLFVSLVTSADPLTKITNPVTKPIVLTDSPLKKNILVVDGRSYLLPDYLKILKSENGKFSVDKLVDRDHKVGNGGDYLRGQFLGVGQQVLNYLEQTQEGKDLLANNRLDIDILKASLDINKIVVVNDVLIDNTGSVVDAIGVPDLIILNSESWMNHFENQRNIYYLVFHELLRSSAVNDDAYIISKNVVNFPSSFRLNTQIIPSLPLLDEDNISSIIVRSGLQTGGTGCPNTSGRLFTDFNFRDNTLELSFYDYVTRLNAGSSLDRKSCNLIIPVNLPKNKKLVVSLIDLQGDTDGQVGTSSAVAKISFEAFLAGSSQKIQTKNVALSQGRKSFLFRKTNVLNSTCGGQSVLRLNSNVILTKTAVARADASVETLAVKKVKIFLNVEDCVP